MISERAVCFVLWTKLRLHSSCFYIRDFIHYILKALHEILIFFILENKGFVFVHFYVWCYLSVCFLMIYCKPMYFYSAIWLNNNYMQQLKLIIFYIFIYLSNKNAQGTPERFFEPVWGCKCFSSQCTLVRDIGLYNYF